MSLALEDKVPHFALYGVDGREHTLESYQAASLLVLIQSCNHCPYVQGWEGRIKATQRDYASLGVRIVAFNSNDPTRSPDDSFDEMTARAERENFNFDYLHDADQSLARSLGAERTPEVFLFNGDRKLVYHGAIDDSRDETAVQQHYLRDALDAVLVGATPPVTDTAPLGCTIKWRDQRVV
jgi:peroxiredoxin